MPPLHRLALPFGTYDVTAFGVALALGILAGWSVTLFVASRRAVEVSRASVAYAVAVALASVLTYVIARIPAVPLLHGRHAPVVACAAAAVAALGAFRRAPVLARLDVASATAATVLAAARYGCHASGCHRGRLLAADAPAWLRRLGHVRKFVHDDVIVGSDAFLAQLRRGQVGIADASGLPVHPAALYEAVGLTLAVGVALTLVARTQVPGRAAAMTAVLAASALGVGWAARVS